jgi:hypothetical protein
MALDVVIRSRKELEDELLHLPLTELVKIYIDAERIFLVEQNIDEKRWIETLDIIEIAEERLWQFEYLDIWIPIYKRLAHPEQLANKVHRYENYIKRAESIQYPSTFVRHILWKFRTFLTILYAIPNILTI